MADKATCPACDSHTSAIMMDAEKRAAKAEFDAQQLRNRLNELKQVIGQPLTDFEDRDRFF